MAFQLSSFKYWKMMLWKCCTQYANKFGKLSSGHRTGQGVFIPTPKKGNARECSNYCTIALISHASKVMLKILQARLQQWHPIPVLLPGKSHGLRSLVGCSPWGHKELDTTEWLHFPFHFHSLEKEMPTHSSVLAWRIPGMEELGRLPSMGSQRVRRDWATELNWTGLDVFWNSLPFSMIQRMLAIWSLVPLPFLNLAWTSGLLRFTYCWGLAWRILSITLLACEMSAIVQ